MTTRAIIRLAQIAHEYDLAGRPREADVIEDAMMRLADGSAVGNWWDGVKQIGTGLADDAKAWGNAVAAPFEAAGAGAAAAWNTGWDGVKQIGTGLADDAKAWGNAVAAPFEAAGAGAAAAWNTGIKNAPAAAQQAADQGFGRADQYARDYAHNLYQGAGAAAGPGGTGLPGAIVQDGVSAVGNAVNNAAQGYVSNAVSAQEQAKEQANMAQWLQQAFERHRKDGRGWDVINSAIQYGGLSAENQAKLRQQFQAAASQHWQYAPTA